MTITSRQQQYLACGVLPALPFVGFAAEQQCVKVWGIWFYYGVSYQAYIMTDVETYFYLQSHNRAVL